MSGPLSPRLSLSSFVPLKVWIQSELRYKLLHVVDLIRKWPKSARAHKILAPELVHLWVIAGRKGMDYGIWESMTLLAGNQLGGPEKVWGIQVYGLSQVWVKTESTLFFTRFNTFLTFLTSRVPNSLCDFCGKFWFCPNAFPRECSKKELFLLVPCVGLLYSNRSDLIFWRENRCFCTCFFWFDSESAQETMVVEAAWEKQPNGLYD